ncbi:uncharacterized protein LOC117173044 isoform X3 [Belonocnema kinseyi]|uniref:uncharacterized protein LOC117173044 isoform X3 n=1 Tax=Belonocnema kinseyi TaxID=2817044 RepID=UPI00143DB338|nr:uncharacterized protein LOC117173044 isoform X3 [Belonocnema kinseyi]
MSRKAFDDLGPQRKRQVLQEHKNYLDRTNEPNLNERIIPGPAFQPVQDHTFGANERPKSANNEENIGHRDVKMDGSRDVNDVVNNY